jgi:flagellar biosynthesis protein FlhB
MAHQILTDVIEYLTEKILFEKENRLENYKTLEVSYSYSFFVAITITPILVQCTFASVFSHNSLYSFLELIVLLESTGTKRQ